MQTGFLEPDLMFDHSERVLDLGLMKALALSIRFSSLPSSMSALTTASLSTEVFESTLLTLERITIRLAVLALNASRNPEQSPRVRILLGSAGGYSGL